MEYKLGFHSISFPNEWGVLKALMSESQPKRKPGGQPGYIGKTRKGFGRVDRYQIVRIQVFDWGIREGMKKSQQWADRASRKKAIALLP